MPAGRSIGTIFVDFDINFDPITRGQKKLLQESQTVGVTLEENFRRLGIKTSAEFDLMRQKITNAYARISQDARATANDVLRAEQEKNRQLAQLNDQQFGKQFSLLESLRSHWLGVSVAVGATYGAVRLLTSQLDAFRDWAFQIRDLQFLAGGTAAEISGLVDVLKDYRVGVDEVERAMNFLSNAIYQGSPALERLGIRFRETSGHFKSGLTLFYETIDALHTMRNETERNALGSEIFGRQWLNLIPVVQKGAAALREAAEASKNPNMEQARQVAEQYEQVMNRVNNQLERFRQEATVFALGGILRPGAEEQQIFGHMGWPIPPTPPGIGIEDVRAQMAGRRGPTPIPGETPAEKKAEEERNRVLLANIKEQQKETDRLRENEYDLANSAKYANDQFEEQDRLWREGIERAKEQQREIERLREQEYGYADAAKNTNEHLDEQDRLWKEGIERAKEQQKEIERLRDAEYDFAGSAQATLDAMQEAADRITAIRNEFQELFDSIGSGISTAIKGVILGTQTLEQAFQNMAQNILLSISDTIIKQGLNKLSEQLVNLGVSLIGGLITPGLTPAAAPAPVFTMQHGGVVTRPTLAVLGEAGPEAVVPLSAAGGPTGPLVQQTIVVAAGVPEAIRSEVTKMLPMIERRTVEAMIAARNRGGAVARLFGQKGT